MTFVIQKLTSKYSSKDEQPAGIPARWRSMHPESGCPPMDDISMYPVSTGDVVALGNRLLELSGLPGTHCAQAILQSSYKMGDDLHGRRGKPSKFK
jgi:hypothetical protein